MENAEPEDPEKGGKENGETPGRPALEFRRAWAPITGMVIFILITISLALFVAPLYISQGLQAFGEEGATNPLIAVYYLVMIIVVTAIILLLRKFLKRRKRNILKYILAAAVMFSTYAVVSPVLDVMVNGMPEEWQVQDLDIEDPYRALPIGYEVDDPSILMINDGSLAILRYGEEGYEIAHEMTDIDQVIPVGPGKAATGMEPDVYRFAVRRENQVSMYFCRDGTLGSETEPWTETIGFDIGENISLIDASTIYDGMGMEYEVYIITNGSGMEITGLMDGNRTTYYRSMEDIKFSMGYGSPILHSGGDIYSTGIVNGSLRLIPISSLEEDILWIRAFGERYVIGTTSGLHLMDRSGGIDLVFGKRVLTPMLVHLTADGDRWEIVAIRGSSLYIIDEDGYMTWSISGYDYLTIYEDRPGGTLTIVSDEKIERGKLPETGTDLAVELGAFGFAICVVFLLLWKPKWWIVDLSGILMGAGVLTLIGISISILPILLLLVLLAVYDFISVYKTKHMLALADSVVESKLPILLVFPLKWGYRYEDEKNLTDRSRPREAMFMGLGDVIIPGALLISAYTFLPSDGINFLGLISPQLSVVLFSLVGMLIAFLFLMYQVLKGKAHAGLPFLNGGVILGFLVGELMIYGSIII